MKTLEPLVKDFMTSQPQAIEATESALAARNLMRRFEIRHLPVMRDGVVVGLISDRDLNLVSCLDPGDTKEIQIIDVCSDRPYAVHPDTPLRKVLEIMIKKHFGCAIVMQDARLIGILTTADVCRAFEGYLVESFEARSRRRTG